MGNDMYVFPKYMKWLVAIFVASLIVLLVYLFVTIDNDLETLSQHFNQEEQQTERYPQPMPDGPIAGCHLA
jgi:ABC-type spermidine/putrescine transport system permease subunit I